jgi:hypothetical protein
MTVQFLVTGELVTRLCRLANLPVHPAQLLEASAEECVELEYNMAYCGLDCRIELAVVYLLSWYDDDPN